LEMASETQIARDWKRVGYDGTYFSVQRLGCCTAPKGGDYSSLRLLLQPIGRGRLKCWLTVLTSDWNEFIDVLEDGKKKGEICILRALAGRGHILIGVIDRKTRVVTVSIRPGPNTSGAEGVVIGEMR
jgi:hypothetical protein